MRGFLVALLALATAAPASAGAEVDIDWLRTDGEGCDSGGGSDGNETSGNGSAPSRSWHRWRSCWDAFTYADARLAKDGEVLAAADAGADDASSSSESSSAYESSASGSSYSSHARSYATSGTDSSSWSRDVAVRADALDAAASRGCSSRSAYGESGTYEETRGWDPSPPPNGTGDETAPEPASHGDGSGWSSSRSVSSDHASSRCSDGVVVARGSTDASVARVDRCDGSSTGSGERWSSWRRDHSTSAWSTSRREDSDCFYGAQADADGTQATAGLASRCSSRTTEGGYDERGHHDSWSWSTSECRYGVAAAGPDDASAFAGARSTWWYSCDDDRGCSAWSWRTGEAMLEWRHNPLGPSPVGTTFPLP